MPQLQAVEERGKVMICIPHLMDVVVSDIIGVSELVFLGDIEGEVIYDRSSCRPLWVISQWCICKECKRRQRRQHRTPTNPNDFYSDVQGVPLGQLVISKDSS